MISRIESWRRHLWLWLVPAGFCVLNLLGFALYRSAFAGKVERLESQYQNGLDQRDAMRDEQVVIEDFLSRLEAHREETDGLYSEYFQTEARRFTRVIQEVKQLARQAGLQPASLSYPRKDFSAFDLVQRNISFNVEGTYDQLRKFMNFLEITDQFVTLESVSLGESGSSRRNPTLGINLVLSTMFATREVESRSEEPKT